MQTGAISCRLRAGVMFSVYRISLFSQLLQWMILLIRISTVVCKSNKLFEQMKSLKWKFAASVV